MDLLTQKNSFETNRLIIRPTTLNDAEFIYNLMNTPKWIKYIGDRNVHSIQKAEEYIKKRMLPQLKRLGYSNYTILRKEDNQKIGTCGLYDRDGLDGIDIGFALFSKFEGMGFAFEATKRILEAAFQEFGIITLYAITAKDNVGSQKLLEKLGLKLNGTTILSNDSEKLLLYKITNKDLIFN